MADAASRSGAAARARSRPPARALVFPFWLTAGLALLAVAYVLHIVWSRWPDYVVAPGVPSVPITIAGVVFNVPPAAIRVPLQRRPGAQERIDLAFLWPSLEPPDPTAKIPPSEEPKAPNRLFVTIAASGGTLPPLERMQQIYPRYYAKDAFAGPGGLIGIAFRDGTPYQGEDLFYPDRQPERFIVRCSRPLGETPGQCLYERRVGAADITVRFPRDWLADWQGVARGVDRLIARLRPAGR